MDGKQVMFSIIMTLLVLTTFSFLPIDGQIICPWCDESMQPRLLNCVYSGMISNPELLMIPLQDIEKIKWQVSSYSDSMVDMPYDVKKLKVDKMFVSEMANVIKRNDFQNNQVIINVISELAGNCYSSVTGYDHTIVTQDVKAMIQSDISKNIAPIGGNPNPDPNSRMAYSGNQNQPSNFQPYGPMNQSPLNNVPFITTVSSPVNFFDNPPLDLASLPPINIFHPSFVNKAHLIPPRSPPANFFNNPPFRNNAPSNPPRSSAVKIFGNPPSEKNDPFNPPGSSSVNSFNNPPGSSSVNSFNNPPFLRNAPNHPMSPKMNPSNNHSFIKNASKPSRNWPSNDYEGQEQGPMSPQMNPSNNHSFIKNASKPSRNWPSNDYEGQGPMSPQMNPSNNHSFIKNASKRSRNWPSNDYEGQGQARSDFSKNQTPPGGPPGSSLQNDNESQDYQKSPDNTALVSTASPQISTPSQNSMTTDSDSSENSNWTTPSPNTDASGKKTPGNEKSDDEEQPCDEKFKIALYEKLINDNRFCTFFGRLPISATKPEVPKIIKHALKEYGIKQHYTEFSTFWRFESKTLNKESTVEDWDEVISKILKIIFARNDLLKGDCEEAGKKMASYILDTFPGDPAASSTENTNQNDGDDETSTEANLNSSGQKTNPASNSTVYPSAENNFNSENSTDSENLSFPELYTTLASIFKQDGSTEQNDGKVPFSELLSAFEIHNNLEKLHSAAENCITPSGFDFNEFLTTMTEVTDSIQNNHPDWSHDKCQKEMYSAAVAVLTKVLQDALKNDNNNAKIQFSSIQPDSAVDASDAQSSNFGAQPEVPNDYSLSSDFVSDSVPQPPAEPEVPNDYNLFSDYSPYPEQGTDFVSGSIRQPSPVQPEAPNDYNLPSDDSTYPKQGTDFVSGSIRQPPPVQPEATNDYNLPSDDSTYPKQGTDFVSGSIRQLPPVQPEAPNDYNLPSDDSTYPKQGTDFASGSFPQVQQDFTNYRVNEAGPVPSSGNQPGPGDWRDGLIQPSNLAPGPVNTNYGVQTNGNLQNAPFSLPSAQNFPLQDYPAGSPTRPQPYSGIQPFQASQNAGFLQSPNFASDSGVVNPPNGNFGKNQFQADNFGNDYNFNAGPSEERPVVPNANSQNFPSYQDYDYGVPASGQNYNTQLQFNSNYNPKVPSNGPVIPQW
ncbi:unnamed protein product [Larinioides sclopetarius]|uniref:Spidroin N-terminal domain-containing protein n=1 Tax=Larinioides sclopetarius TaxID=280406 RepID=A0AAV1YT98_9ARAC